MLHCGRKIPAINNDSAFGFRAAKFPFAGPHPLALHPDMVMMPPLVRCVLGEHRPEF